MTTLLSRSFNGGTAGASAAAEFTTTSGAAPVYHVASAVEGGMGCRFVSSAGLSRGDITIASSGTAWVSFYITVESAPPAISYISEWRNSGVKVGDLRMNTDRTLTMRDGTTAIAGVTSPALPVGQHRIAYRVTPGSATGHQLRVYLGANKDGTTPDFNAQGAATSAAQTAVTTILVGINTSSTWSFGIDRLIIDNLSEPGPAETPLSFTAATATGWTATGGAALAVLSDADDATYLTSSVNPSGQVLGPLVVPAIETPAGDFVVTVRAQRLDSTSGSMVGTLRDSGGTVIATASSVTLGTAMADVLVTFPAANLTAVTQSQWRSGLLRVQLAVTAA